MMYVIYCRLSITICIRNNILNLLPIVLGMNILYKALLKTGKIELAICFHLFPQLIRQAIISAFPDHLHKTAASSEVPVT